MAQRQKEKFANRMPKTRDFLYYKGHYYKSEAEKRKLSPAERERLNANLLDAVGKGNNDDIVRLIKAGANINARGNGGERALQGAALNGYAQTCALLIQEYAKLGKDAKKLIIAKYGYNNGRTILHGAACNGHTETCKFLIEEYAKSGGDRKELIAAKDRGGWTPMMYAAKDRHTQTAHFLAVELIKATFGNETATAFMKSFGECVAT